jgi:type IV secretion system protein VirD4
MENANTWVKPALYTGLALAVLGVWAYLAGGIFLMAFDRPFDDATPATLFQYWYYYGETKQVVRWLWISSGLSLAICLAPGAFFFSGEKRSLFGDARFAKKSEVKKAGLLGSKGIIVGLYKRSYLVFGGSQHVIMSAPTRSGKGVGIVVPNLLTWSDSAVVLDIKQENHAITSGFRAKHGQKVYLFNPAAVDYRTHRYNPLAYLSDDKNIRIDDIQKIGNMLFPDQPGTDPIWTATPRMLFLGIVLFLVETPGKLVTLGQVLRETLADGDGSKYFAKQINERANTTGALSGECIRALSSYITIASDNTRSGVMSSFRSRLELWANPLVDAATSANDFDLRDVRKKRMSVFVGVTPDNLDRMAPLLNLFFQQLIDLNTRELPERNAALKYQCLILPDEFTAMGKIDVLSKGISYIAGYGLRMLPIVQSPAQIVHVYGKEAAQTFTTNHALQIVFPPKASELDTARDISEWLGYQTVKGTSLSRGKGWFSKKQESLSESDQKRALLLPQEITGLGKGAELVVVEDCPPILAKKIRYYNDHVFMDRLKSVSPSLAQLGKKLPTEKQLKDIVTSGECASPVPTLNMDAHMSATGSNAPTTVTVPSPAATTTTVTVERPVTAADVPKLGDLALKNFAVNFTAIPPLPTGDAAIDTAAIEAYADQLCRDIGIAA